MGALFALHMRDMARITAMSRAMTELFLPDGPWAISRLKPDASLAVGSMEGFFVSRQ